MHDVPTVRIRHAGDANRVCQTIRIAVLHLWRRAGIHGTAVSLIRLSQLGEIVVTGMSKIAAESPGLARAFQQRQLRRSLFPHCLIAAERRCEKSIATMTSLLLNLLLPGVG